MKEFKDNRSNIIKTLAIICAMALIFCSFSLSLSATEENDGQSLSSTESDYVIYSADELYSAISDSLYTDYEVVQDEEIALDVLSLTSTAETSEASITLSLNINADTYKFMTVLIGNTTSGAALHVKFKQAGQNKYGSILKNNYGVDKTWQFLSFDMRHADITDWNGTVDTLTLEYLKPWEYPSGTTCRIAGMILAKNTEAALPAAEEIVGNKWDKVHSITEFTEADLPYFSGTSSTSVSAENGILKFTGTEHNDSKKTSDPYVSWTYPGFTDQTVTADDFNYIEFIYRTSGASSNKIFNIYYITSNSGYAETHRTDNGQYTDSSDWNSLKISFIGEADWTGNITKIRLDWDGGGEVDENGIGAILEIAEINFYNYNNSLSDFDFSSAIDDLSQSATYMTVEIAAAETESDTEKITFPIFDGDQTESEAASDTNEESSDPETVSIGEEETTEEETLPEDETDDTEEETLPNEETDGTEKETLPNEETDGTEIETLPEDETDDNENETFSDTDESDESSSSESESESESQEVSDSNNETTEEPSDELTEDTSDESNEASEDSSESTAETNEESSAETEDTNDIEETFDETLDSPNDPNDTGENESSSDQPKSEGSQMPFYIACGAMGTLSIGSIGSVIAIKMRSKILIWKMRSRFKIW